MSERVIVEDVPELHVVREPCLHPFVLDPGQACTLVVDEGIHGGVRWDLCVCKCPKADMTEFLDSSS
jgi:hypothetical protein